MRPFWRRMKKRILSNGQFTKGIKYNFNNNNKKKTKFYLFNTIDKFRLHWANLIIIYYVIKKTSIILSSLVCIRYCKIMLHTCTAQLLNTQICTN